MQSVLPLCIFEESLCDLALENHPQVATCFKVAKCQMPLEGKEADLYGSHLLKQTRST